MSVELNTNLNSVKNNNSSLLNNTSFTSNQATNPNSVFASSTSNNNNSNPLAQPVSGNYEDDILMPEFLKTDNVQKQMQVQMNTNKPVQQDNTPETQSPQIDESKIENSLLARDKSIAFTDKGNLYRKTSASKNGLAVLGFLAPVSGKIIEWFKGGKFTELFKFKQLAIACPAVALAGYGVGSLIDGYINSKRAKEADKEVMLRAPQDVLSPQKEINS